MITNLLRRARVRSIRFLNSYGLLLKVRSFAKVTNNLPENRKKLLIVAPGEVQIPSQGWGAVETIISETIVIYESAGFEVWLLNSKHPAEWKKAKKIEFSVILNHSDTLSERVRKYWPDSKIVVITHYGFAGFPDRWDRGYKKILEQMDTCDFVVCLSSQIFEVFLNYFDKSKLIVSSNGTSFAPQISDGNQENILCLGKLEPRKKQFELWNCLKDSEINIIFAGPIVDERINQILKENPSLSKTFIGPLSRTKLESEFRNFKALILPSTGEGDALVLYEAQMAGLQILVSSSGVGAQDSRLDWVHIIDEEPEPSEISKLLKLSNTSPNEIAQFASRNYNWGVRNIKLVNLLTEISNSEQKGGQS